MNVLNEAADIVDGPRREAYGDPSVNHSRTALLWSAYLGIPISARQVCWLNILQKASRDAHAPKRDNIVDCAGWARNIELCDGAGDSAESPSSPTSPADPSRISHIDSSLCRCKDCQP